MHCFITVDSIKHTEDKSLILAKGPVKDMSNRLVIMCMTFVIVRYSP